MMNFRDCVFALKRKQETELEISKKTIELEKEKIKLLEYQIGILDTLFERKVGNLSDDEKEEIKKTLLEIFHQNDLHKIE